MGNFHQIKGTTNLMSGVFFFFWFVLEPPKLWAQWALGPLPAILGQAGQTVRLRPRGAGEPSGLHLVVLGKGGIGSHGARYQLGSVQDS